MVIITTSGAIDTAVEVMKIGANEYICKSFGMEPLQSLIENVAYTAIFAAPIEKIDIARVSQPYSHLII